MSNTCSKQAWPTTPGFTPKLHHAHDLYCLLQPPVNKAGQVVGTATAAVASGTKIFTDLGFEAGSAALQLATQHVFASTASGAVFQIDYAKWVTAGEVPAG
jgi:hypothetical protein